MSTNSSVPFQSHYMPNTPAQREEMLEAIGIDSIDRLFEDIPAENRSPSLNIPPPTSELELRAEMEALAGTNRNAGGYASFLGAGVYNHFIPSIVKPLITRGEFLTSYTPYQAEASQGTLQVAYEFQTMICSLMGMEVANDGMYEGASSLAEAALMACRVTGSGGNLRAQHRLPHLQRSCGDLRITARPEGHCPWTQFGPVCPREPPAC